MRWARRVSDSAKESTRHATDRAYRAVMTHSGTGPPRTMLRCGPASRPAPAGRGTSPPRSARRSARQPCPSERLTAEEAQQLTVGGCGRRAAIATPTTPGRPPSRPNVTSTSSAPTTGVAPSTRRRFVPSEAGLRTDPGTAITGTPRTPASVTVSRSHRGPSTRPRRPRRRMRQGCGCGRGTGGCRRCCGTSEHRRPRRPTSSHRPALQRG